MDVASVLQNTGPIDARLDAKVAASLAPNWTTSGMAKGTYLSCQGEPDQLEHILLSGNAISHISDAEGRSVCVGFHVGACVVTPNIARTISGVSLVTIELTTDAIVASMPAEGLLDLMVSSVPIRGWANGILRNEIGLKAEREWCLAALKGVDRLNWFRKRFPRHEEFFGHTHIASYLGMTPVTLSRLRNAQLK